MVEDQVEKILQREIEIALSERKSVSQPTLQVVQAPVAAKKETRYDEVDDIDIVDDWDYDF